MILLYLGKNGHPVILHDVGPSRSRKPGPTAYAVGRQGLAVGHSGAAYVIWGVGLVESGVRIQNELFVGTGCQRRVNENKIRMYLSCQATA